MKLKKLTISGFKSFADRVVIDFDCEIIGIVGPNGCGKSNIVDAFRWVLGEQSAKSLRGDKMHDVLFAGTDQRKPLNFAEVSLTFTDIGSALPTPYEELTVARRLYRSGESEYFINKETARLRDIQGLFLGSGIGKNAFSIFEQGKLDQIIHLSPLERRAIFDEAAGTSRFLLRKKESVRKLSEVNDNFVRMRDVHAEIEKQAKQLKKQATHAKNYQDNAERLEFLEKNVLLFRWKKIGEKQEGLKHQLQALSFTIEEKMREIAELERAQNQEKQDSAVGELAAKQHLKELNLCETKVRVHEAEIAQKKQRILEIKKREESVKSQYTQLLREQDLRSKEIAVKERQLLALNCPEGLKEIIQKGREDYLKKVQEEGRLNSEIQKKTYTLEAKTARLKTLVAVEATQATTQKVLQETIACQREKVETLSMQIDASKEELALIEKELQLLRKTQAELQKEEHTLLRQKTEKEGHQKVLIRLKEDMEGFSVGSKALLKETKNAKSPLYAKVEPLFEYLIPFAGYEELLATSLKHYAETLIVPTEEDFSELLTFAKKNGISDFSVIVKSKIPSFKQAPKSGLAAYVEDGALAYHLTSGITPEAEGHFYDNLGVFFHVGAHKKPSNTFQRRAELKSLTDALEILLKKINAHTHISEETFEKLKLIEKRRSELFESRRKKEMDLVKENFTLQQALSDFERLQTDVAALTKEKESLSHLADEENEITQSKKRLVSFKEEGVALLRSLQQQESDLEKWREHQQHSEILKAKLQQSAGHEKKLAEEIEELHKRAEETLKAIVNQERELESSRLSLKRLQIEAKEMERRLLEAKKAQEMREKEIGQKRKILAGIEKEAHTLEVVLAQDLSEKKGIEEELLTRHALALGALESRPAQLEGSLEEVSREIHALRSALESAGAINMTAIAEFQETQARFDYLDGQLKDLETSKSDLEEIISKLDHESRKIFRKTFQQIRENFQRNFAILFNGGSAELTFTESSDILEAGVEIVAKPPGKHMRSISLLSGGEKCLTALALLFSIFEVRPAPFCILDEVDAPLDDSNIDRFTSVLKKFIEHTQFIIVTHNKKTMAIADLLIGVSMEEKGVSRLISLIFEKNGVVRK